MGSSYGNGKYNEALDIATLMHDKIKTALKAKGADRNNSIYASSLNNLALMNKNLGNNELAMEQYVEALMIYKNIFKTNVHVSYAATLTNLGMLYKMMAESSKGIDKDQLLARSEEALNDALDTRRKLLGKKSNKEGIDQYNITID